jgi:putative ABC transport system permease protein
MTGIALGLDTLTTSLVSRRASVEAQLMLGATRRDAAAPVTREALRSALMPTINSMAVTGVVSLPGMMTGQILGGVPPAEAVKYQDPRHVPDCGGHWLGSGNGGAGRRLSPHRWASPPSPRSAGLAEG